MDGKSLDLPINLDSGEARTILVKAPMLLEKSVNDALLKARDNKHLDLSKMKLGEVNALLGEQDTDLLDNKVKLTVIDLKTSIRSISSPFKRAENMLTLMTGRGIRFTISAVVTKNKLPGTVSAIEFRDELLEKEWPDDHRVAELVGNASGPEAATYAIRAQASGDLLGVWPASRHCFLYPDFQSTAQAQYGKTLPDSSTSCPAKTIAAAGDGRSGCIRRMRCSMTRSRQRYLLTIRRG